MDFQSNYNLLTDGQKRKVRQAFIDLFGHRATFYRKLAGTVRVRKFEENFFKNHLTPKQNDTQIQPQ